VDAGGALAVSHVVGGVAKQLMAQVTLKQQLNYLQTTITLTMKMSAITTPLTITTDIKSAVPVPYKIQFLAIYPYSLSRITTTTTIIAMTIMTMTMRAAVIVQTTVTRTNYSQNFTKMPFLTVSHIYLKQQQPMYQIFIKRRHCFVLP